MLFFRNDYGNGAHPAVMEALCRTNLELTVGYGQDPYCREAAELIRGVCACPGAAVHFIPGGTQANKTALGAFLRPYEAVIAADSGHINGHEAGAIEHNGHKICTAHAPDGKLTPEMIRAVCAENEGDMAVSPRLVYISNTTELGTVYSLAELRAIRAVCRERNLLLYCDGARMAVALAASDITLADYAQNCDAFTIGGTKNGLLFGEALVITDPALMTGFRNCMKQQGAILAKGRLLGVQYGAILKDGLYQQLGRQSNDAAHRLAQGLKKLGISFLVDSPSNQLFPILPEAAVEKLEGQVSFERWSRVSAQALCVRFVTAWHTTQAEVDQLLALVAAALAE